MTRSLTDHTSTLMARMTLEEPPYILVAMIYLVESEVSREEAIEGQEVRAVVDDGDNG